MPKLIKLDTHTTHEKGSLTVFEKHFSNEIKRVFYIYGNQDAERGNHRHKSTTNALICVSGSCSVEVHNGQNVEFFNLTKPDICLILEPHEWRRMYNFSENAILLVISDQYYNPDDYISTPY